MMSDNKPIAETPSPAPAPQTTSESPAVAAAAATPAESTVVFVSNISPAANEKTISDFFSFCGEIKALVLRRKASQETLEAIVTFESSAAAKTAQLLTNALIVDRAIVVRAYDAATDAEPSDKDSAVPKDQITQKNFGGVPDAQRSVMSVMASLLASGYVLGEDAKTKAVEYDTKLQFSAQVKETATKIDTTLHLTENVGKATSYMSEQLKVVDQSLGLTQKAQVVKEETSKIATRISETPAVASAINWIGSIGTAISHAAAEVRAETSAAIDAKYAERGVTPTSTAAPAAATADAVPATTETVAAAPAETTAEAAVPAAAESPAAAVAAPTTETK